MKFTPASGVNSVRKFTAVGSTIHARKPPAKNSGVAAAMNPTVIQRSRLASAGAINAHIWKSHQGADRITPTKSETLIFMSKEVATAEKFRAAVRLSAVRLVTGSLIASITRG